MSPSNGYRKLALFPFVAIISITFSVDSFVYFDADSFAKELNKRSKQTALCGYIDSLTINRGNGSFQLEAGRLTLFDFGAYRPSALVFEGEGTFTFSSPDDVDRQQLSRYLNKERISTQFKSLCIFYSVELEIDTAGFERIVPLQDPRNRLVKSQEVIGDHLHYYTQARLAGDIISGMPGMLFLAEFESEDIGRIVYVEDPASDDLYRVCRLIERSDSKTVEVISGYSPDESLPSQRGIRPVDIQHYDIRADVNKSGQIKAVCKINFIGLRGGWRYIYFNLSGDAEIKRIRDFESNTLDVVRREGIQGIGVVLNRPLRFGEADSIEIEYEAKPFDFDWEYYYSSDSVYWYPESEFRDVSTYEIEIEYPYSYLVVLNSVESELREEDEIVTGRWQISNRISRVRFYMGQFLHIENSTDMGKYIRMFVPIAPEWGNATIVLRFPYSGYEYLQVTIRPTKVMDEIVKLQQQLSAFKTIRDLTVFENVYGDISFDTLVFVEDPARHCLGSGGMICMSSYQEDGLRVADPLVRAHETAHQWWGENIGIESYRDLWIIEGLAEYSAFISLQNPLEGEKARENLPATWAKNILDDSVPHAPLSIFPRCGDLREESANSIFISKSAYIFHMIHYLLWDYEEKSDAPFITFLRAVFDRFKSSVITTRGLRILLEEHSGQDMGWFFDQWVFGTEIPEFSYTYLVDKIDERDFTVTFHIEKKGVADNFKIFIPVNLQLENYSLRDYILWIDQPNADTVLASLPVKPKKIVFNTFDAVLCKVDYK